MPQSDYSKVIIKDLQLEMLIGIYDHEKANKQRVLVNAEIFVGHKDHWHGDSYDDVLCYETVVRHIQSVANKGHVNLVESFAHEIADYCLENEMTQSVIIRIEKPDIMPETRAVGFEVHKSKNVA